MFEAVDLYCERSSPDFWAEPLNALTNASFLVSAWFSWRRARHLEATSLGVWILLGLICCISIGSSLFHTFANNLTRLLDVLPILFFQLTYVWLYCREIAKVRAIFVFSIVLAYLFAVFIGRQFPHILNGSLIYGPAIIVLLVLSVYHATVLRVERYVVLTATAVFMVALICRTIDIAICPYFPLGTHFLWHVCNAIMLYLLLRAFVANLSIKLRVVSNKFHL